jgi:hypothetical protein
MPLPATPVELPIWKGRRGMGNTLACGVLGLLRALGLWLFAARAAAEPAGIAYGQSHDMTYVDCKVYSHSRHESAACVFRTRSGAVQDISLRDAVSYFTDLWVGFAFAIEITVPAFIILFAVARAGLHLASVRRNAAGVQR